MSSLHVTDLIKKCRDIYNKDTMMVDLENIVSRLPEMLTSPGVGEKAFIKQHSFKLPPALEVLGASAGKQLRMGFLAELNYTWVSIDNELVLIDLIDNRRIIRLSMEAYVDYCTIVVPSPFAFAIETRYILAVALSNQIKLYLITYPKETKTLDNTVTLNTLLGNLAPDTNIATKASLLGKTTSLSTKHWATASSSVQLLAAPLRQHRFIISDSNIAVALPTDSTVTQMIATRRGRLFAGLTNGSLVEVMYMSHNEGLLSNLGLLSAITGMLPGGFSSTSAGIGRAKLVDHTSLPIVSSIPFISDILRPKPIKQCVVDDTRDLLYTLHEDNRISIYALSDNIMTSFKRYKPYTSFKKDLLMHSNEVSESIVQIWPITKAESMSLNLVAMTDIGQELYYSLSACGTTRDTFIIEDEYYADFISAMRKTDTKNNQVYDFSYDKLTLKSIVNPFRNAQNLSDSSCICFFRSRGISLAGLFDNISQQNIVFGYINEFSVHPRVQRCTREILTDVLTIPSGQTNLMTAYPQKIVDMVELDFLQASGLTLSSTHLSSNPQLYQYNHAPRSIAIITTSEIIIYNVLTPVERIRTLIDKNLDLTKQIEIYGDQEFRCLLLAIACQDLSQDVVKCATQRFFENMIAADCAQIAAIKRYLARLLGPLCVYPYWRGASISGSHSHAIQGEALHSKATGGANNLMGFFSKTVPSQDIEQDDFRTIGEQRARSTGVSNAIIQFSEQGRRAYKEGFISKPKGRAESTSKISTKSIFRASSTSARISTSTLTQHILSHAAIQPQQTPVDSSHMMASLTWTTEELLDVRSKVNCLIKFLHRNYDVFVSISNGLQDSDKINVLLESINSISEAIGFIGLIVHPARVAYSSTCLTNFARMHGHPMVSPDSGNNASVKKTGRRQKHHSTNTLSNYVQDGQFCGIYCDLLSIHGMFMPEAKKLLDEIIRIHSVGEASGVTSFSSIGRSHRSLLRGASLRYGVNCDFSSQLKEHCSMIYGVYNVRIQVLQQLDQAKYQPVERRNAIIRRVLEILSQSQSSIEPIEPILDALKELGNYSACVVLLLLHISEDEVALLDALGDDGKLTKIKGSLGIHMEQNPNTIGVYGNKGRTYALAGPQTTQLSPTMEGSFKDVFSKVLQTNINHAHDYYKGCCCQTIGQGPFTHLNELQSSIDSGSVRFPFKLENGFEALMYNDIFRSTISRKDWQESLTKVCNLCNKTLEIVSQGYLLSGIYELLTVQNSSASRTTGMSEFMGNGLSHFGGYSYLGKQSAYGGSTLSTEGGHHDADNLLSLMGVPLRSIHTAVSKATGDSSGQIISVLQSAITRCSSKVWQLQLYYYLYAHYYTVGCILKALQEEETNCNVSVAVITVLKIIENRASLGLLMAVSPYIEGFLKKNNFYLYFRYLEKRASIVKTCTLMFRKATEEKTFTIFPSMINGVAQLGYLTLQDRINILSDALAKLEGGGLAYAGTMQTAHKTVINAPLLGTESQLPGVGDWPNIQDNMADLGGATYTRNVYTATEKVQIEEQAITPQDLIRSIKEVLISARAQLVVLRRLQNIKDNETAKKSVQLDTDGIKALPDLYRQFIVPLHLSDIAIYVLLSSPTRNQERKVLGNNWVAALTNTALPGFTFRQESLLNDPQRGITRGIVKVENLSSSDLDVANIVGKAAQVFRSIIEMCTDLSLTSFDYTIPMTIFALLITNKYKTYDPKQPYDKITAQFIHNLFVTDMITIKEKSLTTHLINSIETLWKILLSHQTGMSTTGKNQLDTPALMESIPISDLVKEDLSYVYKILCYYMVSLIRKYNELGTLGYDPSQTSINKKNIGIRIRGHLPPNAPIIAQLERLCM